MLLFTSNFAGEREKETFLNENYLLKSKKMIKKETNYPLKDKLRSYQVVPTERKVRERTISAALLNILQIPLIRKARAIILVTNLFLVVKFLKAPCPLMSLPEMNHQISRKI